MLEQRTTAFTNAVRAGDVAKAKKLFPTAREPYERIEPVAESFGDLDPRDRRARRRRARGDVDGLPPAREDALGRQRDRRGDEAVRRQARHRRRQARRRSCKTADYQTAQIANGAKSLMDEIGASKVTGEEDRYSHTDLYDFKANVDGARAVFDEPRADPAEARPVTRCHDHQRICRYGVRHGAVPRRATAGSLYTKVDARRAARPLARGRRARRAALEHGGHRRAMSRPAEPAAAARARGRGRCRGGRGRQRRGALRAARERSRRTARRDGPVLRRRIRPGS